MKYLRNYIIFIILLITLVKCCTSCTTFKFQAGVWTCEELGITIDFDNYNGVRTAAINGKGTIIINNEVRDIICGMDATGTCNFFYVEDVDEQAYVKSYIYTGYFKNYEKNKMTFKIANSNKKYTFIKHGR